jgi:hypothetical protein
MRLLHTSALLCDKKLAKYNTIYLIQSLVSKCLGDPTSKSDFVKKRPISLQNFPGAGNDGINIAVLFATL